MTIRINGHDTLATYSIQDLIVMAESNGSHPECSHVPTAAIAREIDRRILALEAAIAAAIQAERDARPPKGHIVTDDGVTRRVLGELPVTADGCVVGDGARVYYEVVGQFSGEPIISEWDVTGVGDDIKVDTYYSTREAAEAAKKETTDGR